MRGSLLSQELRCWWLPCVRECVLARQVPDCLHPLCAQVPTYLLASQVLVDLQEARQLPQAQVLFGLLSTWLDPLAVQRSEQVLPLL